MSTMASLWPGLLCGFAQMYSGPPGPGLTPRGLATEVQTDILGTVSSYVLKGDRRYDVRVLAPSASHHNEKSLESLPIRSNSGRDSLTLQDVAKIDREPGMLELHREDLRQLVAVSARFAGIDLGHGITAIQQKLAKDSNNSA